MSRPLAIFLGLAGVAAVGGGAWLLAEGSSSAAERLDPDGPEIPAVGGSAGAGGAVAEPSAPRLRAPAPPEQWEVPDWARPPGASQSGSFAVAYHFAAPVYFRPNAGSHAVGIVRRGTRLPVLGRAYGSGCDGGSWFQVESGYVCSAEGFAVGTSPRDRPQKPADLTSAMPYGYAIVNEDGAPKLTRAPEPDELPLLADPELPDPDSVLNRMEGDYFVALDRVEDCGGTPWQRTVRGHYVPRDAIEELPMPRMVGQELEGEDLPLAFVFGEDRPLHRVEGSSVERDVGTAEKYARFGITDEVTIDGVDYVVTEDGLAVEREHVRVARLRERSERVESTRYIHVDLDEQVLVAYEDDEPIYATLVSSGREGYDTPRGVFRVDKKFLSATMRGEDPVDGPYEVEEVPWTMYYWKSYALHGAYWHDDFGKVRSHGCTNLAPSDARWVFEWVTPELPAGWHGRYDSGTWVHFTRDSSEESSDDA